MPAHKPASDKLAIEGFRLGRRNRLHRLQLKSVALERHAREPVRLELLGETAQPPIKLPRPLLQIGGCVGLEWQAVGHLTGLAPARQIGVEAAIIAGSFDPNPARNRSHRVAMTAVSYRRRPTWPPSVMRCFHYRLAKMVGEHHRAGCAFCAFAYRMTSMALTSCDPLPDALNVNASRKAGLNRRNVA